MASSLVNYLVGITDINPLRFGLLFERFASVEYNGYIHMNVDVSNYEDLQHYINAEGFPLRINIQKLGWLLVIKRTLDSLKSKGIFVDINNIPLDDAETLALFKRGGNKYVFPYLDDCLALIENVNFNDIVALNTLHYPEREEWIPKFIKHAKGRKRKATSCDCEYPGFEDVLQETHGVLIYQEQAILIIQRLTGYAMGQCNLVRRLMVKKLPERMAKLEPEFFRASIEHEYDRKTVTYVWDKLFPICGYLFCKSHAVAYTLMSYQTTYLKVHYQKEYIAAYETCKYSRMHDVFRR